MTWKKYGLGLLLAGTLAACNDDDGDGVISVPPRDLAEVAAENDAEIREFLQTHFYNYEDFINPPAGFDFRIRIDTLAGENAGKTPLIEQMETQVILVNNEQIGLEGDSGDVPHTLYYLAARDGEGVSPTIADSVLVSYEGNTLNGNSFDAVTTYIWQHLPNFLRGYQNAVSKWQAGTPDQLVQNPDGTSRYANAGIGLMVMPSGLAYFNSSPGTIPAYASLLFKVEMGQVVENADADGDGIPSILEDLNGNNFLYDDNTDRKQEEKGFGRVLIPDFLDPDDDGDGKRTRDEIIIGDDGSLTFPDSNGNGIPDYLDPETR
jgi:hypothetical protein